MGTPNLTSEQIQAIKHGKGPACIIAGAGTGKTTTLSERIIYLTEKQKINPARILVTTFTRKATSELYQRTYERLGQKALQLRISTIDAHFWEIAQKAMEQGLIQPARLIGEANQRLLLLQSARALLSEDYEYFDNDWRGDKLERFENELVSILEFALRVKTSKGKEKKDIKTSIQQELNARFYYLGPFLTLHELQEITEEYLKKLKDLVAIDYGQLSFKLLECLVKHKSFSRALEFAAVLVDEFQDTSRIQAEILLKLSGRNRNIWIVGDPCQQIYEWRGAGNKNLSWFIERTKAKKYSLTDNYRSTQVILDSAYNFLYKRVRTLKKEGMLIKLNSMRSKSEDHNAPNVFAGKLDQALYFVSQLLNTSPDLSPSDIAILSRKLDKKTVEEIRKKTKTYRLKLQFYSTKADDIMEQTIRTPMNWKAGKALNGMYKHEKIQSFITRVLRKKDFSEMRRLRSLTISAEALDSTMPSDAFTFSEAWPALKITQDREITITPAIAKKQNAIRVMTIHAAKGLEFPVVLLMKLGQSFPDQNNDEASRLVYVGATRARDLLIIVHTDKKPQEILAAFGKNLVSIRKDRKLEEDLNIQSSSIKSSPPVIQASDLDLYEQCPLKFAAYHEGRFLPKWTRQQSEGARMHKAIELWLRAGMPRNQKKINQCFEDGMKLGDSPLRDLRKRSKESMRKAFQEIVQTTLKTYKRVLKIESDYRYLHGNSGQIHGIVDAVLERRDGRCVLKEWKSSSEIPTQKAHQYELQVRAGALGLIGQNSKIDSVEIVPVFAPQKSKSVTIDTDFENRSKEMFDQVFKDIGNRNYKPKPDDKKCKKYCDLQPYCPAWTQKDRDKQK